MATDTNFEISTGTAAGLVADVLNGDDEGALVIQAKNGSSAAIEQLVGRCDSRLFRLAQNITSNHEYAEEAVQNAFAKAFRNLATLRKESRFHTWLVRLALTRAAQRSQRPR